jgi:hypothetical protein
MVHLLQEFSQMLSIDQSYEQALNRLGTILGGTFSVDTAENINSEMGQEDAAKVAAFETAKKNSGNRRMATVASVYTVELYVSTAEEITAALSRDEPDGSVVLQEAANSP